MRVGGGQKGVLGRLGPAPGSESWEHLGCPGCRFTSSDRAQPGPLLAPLEGGESSV